MRIFSLTVITISALYGLKNLAMANESPANINMRAGLWEVTTSSDLLLLAPHIPKEQIQHLKDLAKDYGLEMPDIQNGEAISKVCITETMANEKALPNFYQQELGCATTNVNRDGNRYSSEFTCNSDTLKGEGRAEGLIDSMESFTGKSTFKGVAQGSPVNETADIDGRWLSASCGNVQPL